jgi:putative nucleotidyltransferase with HDIG domain
VISLLRADAAAVLLFNPHLQALEYCAGRGFRTAAVQHGQLHLGEGHAGRAALERRMVTVTNLDSDPGDASRSRLLAAEKFSGYIAVPLMAKGHVKGVLEIFQRTPLGEGQDWQEHLTALAGQAAIAADNATLFDDLQRSNIDLALAYDTTLDGWSRALDLRDRETEGHTRRVAEMALRLARALGVPDPELVHMRRGALLHDIGKMAIPDSVLLKPGPLTEEEWGIMRQHPLTAYELLSSIAFLRPALDIPYCHHERWDGTGYPRGLRGAQIPFAARIFAVADAFDAMRSNRPYRPAMSDDEARSRIAEQPGKQFDPQVVEAFLRLV